MLSFAKFIGLLVAFATFIHIALGDVNPTAEGLARRDAVAYANGLMVDGMNVFGRQAATTVTVTVNGCDTFVSMPTTTTATTTIATTVMTTVPSFSVPVPGSGESATTPVPSMSSDTGMTSAPAGPTTSAPTTSAPSTSAPSTTEAFPPPSDTGSSAAGSLTNTSFTDTPTLPPSPTGSPTSPITSAPAPTGGAATLNYDVLGVMVGLGAAAYAVV